MRAIDRGCLWAGIAAPLVLAVASLVAGRLQPSYSHLHQFISELGASGARYGAVMNYGGLIPAGALTLLFALAMYRGTKGHLALRGSSVLVALIGIGRSGAGFFSCDPGCSMAAMSPDAQLHVAFGLLAFGSGVFAPLLFAWGIRRQGRGPLFWLSLTVGLLSAVLVPVLFRGSPGTPYAGTLQRSLLVLAYGWIVAVALALGAGHRETAVTTADRAKSAAARRFNR